MFTLSCVTGRSAGIGADMNRLGQRVIQMVNGPTTLTGFGERVRVHAEDDRGLFTRA